MAATTVVAEIGGILKVGDETVDVAKRVERTH